MLIAVGRGEVVTVMTMRESDNCRFGRVTPPNLYRTSSKDIIPSSRPTLQHISVLGDLIMVDLSIDIEPLTRMAFEPLPTNVVLPFMNRSWIDHVCQHA